MTDTKDLQLVRVIKVLLNVLIGLAIFAGVGLLLWTAASPIVLSRGDAFGTVTVPVRIGSGGEPQFDVAFNSPPPSQIHAVFVEEAEGTLTVTTTNAWMVVIANAAKIIVLTGLAYIIYLLRAVVRAIEEGHPFSEENANNLRLIGYMVLVMSVLSPVVQYLVARQVVRQLPPAVPALQAGPSFEAGVLLVAMFILLLARLWGYAIELERDRELTV